MLSENIKNLRKQKGYSQETLAQELSVVRQTVSKWEKGYSVPDAIMLERMAELFEVSVGELLGSEERIPQYKSELEQITSQLAILNDQYAREMARKAKIRKILLWIVVPVLALFILSIVGLLCAMFVSCPMKAYYPYGDTDSALIIEMESQMYTQADIVSATDVVMEYFRNEFEDCTMNEIRYAGDDRSAMESEYHKCEVIVLVSTFETGSYGGDGSFNADYTYENWSWMLARDENGNWEVINYGFA